MNSYTFGDDISAEQISSNEYGAFYSTYIQHCKGISLMEQLELGEETLADLIFGLSDEKMMYRYEPDKWSIKQVIGHIIDTERVMAFRALSFARGEKQSLPGYDQDQYVEQANFEERSAQGLLMQYRAVRESTILLFSSMSADMMIKRGTASNVEFTVRALGMIICGHELHHIKILKERYLNS
ncbi:MAG: DinB family protein [Balneolaceae bacterium]